MRRIWDTVGVIFITAMMIYAGFTLIKPYVPWLLLGAIVTLLIGGVVGYKRRQGYW